MSSQKENNSENSQPIYTIPPPVIIASSLAIVAVLVVSFTLYHFCRNCFLNITYTWQFQRSATETLVRVSPNTSTSSSPYKGLDPSLLHSFPMFLYALVKNLQTEKNNILECAICLLEFEENSMLRLLPNCYHVFHPCCIDLWLHWHKTCPICRNNLDPATNETRKCNEIRKGNTEERRGEVTIEVIKEGDGDQRHISDEVVSMNYVTEGKMFVQSHSTGHSTMMIREGDDKHKLKLRANVEFLKKDMVTQRVSSYKDIVMNIAPYPEAIH